MGPSTCRLGWKVRTNSTPWRRIEALQPSCENLQKGHLSLVEIDTSEIGQLRADAAEETKRARC